MPHDPAFDRALRAVAALPANAEAQAMARAHGLAFQFVNWEDTARDKGSVWGPNITDMTLELFDEDRDGDPEDLPGLRLPALRFPNFGDLTVDVPLDDVQIPVGNHAGQSLRRLSLREVLSDLPAFLSSPGDWTGPSRSLLRDADTHALVSAQACFLPIPRGGTTTFTPRLFSYQSTYDEPAVLTLLVTHEGTSIRALDGGRTRLFFNDAGQRACLTGTRASEVDTPASTAPSGATASRESTANLVYVVQVPLKVRERVRAFDTMAFSGLAIPCVAGPPDLEDAHIGHGAGLGPHPETGGHRLERDPRFPVRITVQLYLATAEARLSYADVGSLADRIRAVYGHAPTSLVTDGETGRPTEHDAPIAGPPWWVRAMWPD